MVAYVKVDESKTGRKHILGSRVFSIVFDESNYRRESSWSSRRLSSSAWERWAKGE